MHTDRQTRDATPGEGRRRSLMGWDHDNDGHVQFEAWNTYQAAEVMLFGHDPVMKTKQDAKFPAAPAA